jgi:uncharacterized protein
MATREEDRGTRSGISRPFVHKVATESGKYVFDVNTGEILRVDEIVWEIIEDSCLSETEVIARHTRRFTPDQIAKAYQEISRARTENGYFLSSHPTVGMAVTREEVHRLLTCERHMVTLEVTEKCNFSCTYCHQHLPIAGVVREGTRDMTWETARVAIDDFLGHCCISEPENEGGESTQAPASTPARLKRLGFDDTAYVGFYGGEPLLNFSLIQKCTEYVQEKAKGKARFSLTTNGYLLDGDVAEFLGANDFIVQVSLDGPACIHDRNRRTKADAPTHHVVLEHLQAFIRKYPRQASSISAVIAAGTDPRDIERYFRSADWIPFSTNIQLFYAISPYPGYYPCSPGVAEFPGRRDMYREFKEHLIKGRIHPDKYGREFQRQRHAFQACFAALHRDRWCVAHVRQKSQVYAPPGPCVPGCSRAFVSVTGEYYPCERVLLRKMYQIGSATTGIDEERAYGLLREFIECTRQECEQCWCLPFCTAGCQASVRDHGGFSVGAKRRACEEARDSLHRNLEDYCSILERNPRAFDYFNSKAVPA